MFYNLGPGLASHSFRADQGLKWSYESTSYKINTVLLHKVIKLILMHLLL